MNHMPKGSFTLRLMPPPWRTFVGLTRVLIDMTGCCLGPICCDDGCAVMLSFPLFSAPWYACRQLQEVCAGQSGWL